MKKKIFITLFLMIILLANISLASYSTVTMNVVEEPVCTIDLGNNSNFEKKLVSKDLVNKEVTIQLQVKNGEESNKPTGEIVIVLDNSVSMNDIIEGTNKTRKSAIFDSAKLLVTNLLKDNSSLKIGIVSFSTNVDTSKEGTLEDSKVISTLSNDVSTLTSAISNIDANGPRTDLESGLTLGNSQFTSENNNKYMIVLTDGVPNISLGNTNPYYSDETLANTKTKLQNLEKNNIKLTTMLTGIVNENQTRPQDSKTFKEIIDEIFGTKTSPTAGIFYYINDSEIETTITNTIYNDLVPTSKSYKNIEITDYFPTEIVNNFDFAYVSNSNIGEISAKIDTTNNSITWKIPALENGQTATVQYKLKLKENFDSQIVDKILDTNKKVDITYTDFNNANQSKTSDVSPKLKLSEPPAALPKAGSTTFFIISGTILLGVLVFSFIRLKYINKLIK